jgi:hypothetical protein
MKKVLSIFALLMAASMLFWLAGCGGDDDDDDCADNVAPKVTVAPNGGDIFLNTTITATFSKAVETVTITLGGAAVTPTVAGNAYSFTPTKIGDNQALAITAEDSCGDALEGYTAVSFNVGEEDTTDPELVGGDCEPEDGEDGVDPADVTEIILVFSEDISDDSTFAMVEPEENINAVIDGDTVTIEFLGGWSLSNEQEVELEGAIIDLAGNTADIEYGFTTMAKE